MRGLPDASGGADPDERCRRHRLADLHAAARHVGGRPPIRSGMWAVMSKHVTHMTLEDAEHYTPQQREAIVASYPEHERDARTKGLPALGSRLVFNIPDDAITVDPVAIPNHWARINGLDFGWDHPFAAVSLAHDRDADALYVTHAYREARSTPIIHAAAIKPWGVWIPCAWPHDGLQHDKGSGDELPALYRAQGLNMLQERAAFEDGGSGVEAGVIGIPYRLQTCPFQVFRHLTDWFSEKRGYHRKDGVIVKARADARRAPRYAGMMLRFAEVEPRLQRYKPARPLSVWAV